MLIYTIASIIAAILLWVIGIANWAFLIGFVVLIIGVISSNIHRIISVKTLIVLAILGIFTLIEQFFWNIFTVTNIIFIINALLLLSLLYSAWNEKYNEVSIILIILIIMSLLAPILNAWTPIIGEKTQNVNAQLGIGEKTDGAFSSIGNGMSDIWLMLSDPAKWQENKNQNKGNQEGGTSALEITKIVVAPSTVMPEDEYSLNYNMENFGEYVAENVKIGAQLDPRAAKYGGYLCSDSSCTKNNGMVINYVSIDDVHSGEQIVESFDLVAPDCAGSFTTTAFVEYSYEAMATTNLELINRDYYNELLEHKLLKFKDQVSTSTAGPFKLTIRTQYAQPIPIKNNDGLPKPFKIYFSAINERSGQSYINDITIAIPKGLKITDEESCDFESIPRQDKRYHLKEEKEVDGKTKGKTRCVEADDMISFKCEFEYNESIAGIIDKEKTLFLITGIDYKFTHKKTTVSTIKSNTGSMNTCTAQENEDNDGQYSQSTKINRNELKPKAEVQLKKCEDYKAGDLDQYYAGTKTCLVADEDTLREIVKEYAKNCYALWDTDAQSDSRLLCNKLKIGINNKVCDDDDTNPKSIDLGEKVDVLDVEWTGLDGRYITQNNAFLFEFYYLKRKCTLSGVEISTISKDKVCDIIEQEAKAVQGTERVDSTYVEDTPEFTLDEIPTTETKKDIEGLIPEGYELKEEPALNCCDSDKFTICSTAGIISPLTTLESAEKMFCMPSEEAYSIYCSSNDNYYSKTCPDGCATNGRCA